MEGRVVGGFAEFGGFDGEDFWGVGFAEEEEARELDQGVGY